MTTKRGAKYKMDVPANHPPYEEDDFRQYISGK